MKKFLLILLAAGVGAGIGCNRDNETSKVDAKVRTESDSAGQPIETQAEVAGRVPDGSKIDVKHEEYVGVVTKFVAGKSLEIKASDGETHRFDLADKDIAASVSPSVKQGGRVEVTVEKPKDGRQTISVVPHT
jgi:hypothetical protein